MLPLKNAVRYFARRFGVEISRFSDSPLVSLARAIEAHNIDLVLDIGANIGQFAVGLRGAGYAGHIVSFEPVRSAFATLQSMASHNPKWKVEQIAFGDRAGEATINVSGNGAKSSSILPMLDAHRQAAPDSRYIASEKVKVTTLNDYGLSEPVFLKIDVQGYEAQVLNGASDILPKVQGIHMEMALIPLYEGQELFESLTERLRKSGFNLWGIFPGMVTPQGRMLNVDVALFR